MAKLAVREVEFAYDDAGTGSPVFLFVHGWACDRSFWQPQFEDLSRDHRCIAVDLRGCGETPAVGPFDTTTAAEDLVAILDALDIPAAVVVGHSLGGLVALLLNDRCPDKVLGIVMGDSPLTSSSGGGLARTVQAIRDAGSMEPAAPIVERFFVDATPQEVKEKVRRTMLSCPPEVGAGMLSNGEVFMQRMGELLKAADQKPFMAIWAASPLGNPDRVRAICHYIRQEPMGESGHFFQLEEPAITSALLRAFEDDVRRDPRIADLLAAVTR